MPDQKKILVTGATGHIGDLVIRYLLRNRIGAIVASDISNERAKKNDWYNKVDFIEYDIRNRQRDLFCLFKKPDIAIHLSWAKLPNYNATFHIEENLFHNIFFIKELIESGLRNLSITGTCFEYGMVNGGLSENIPPNPVTPYGVAKDTLRRYVEFISKNNNTVFKWIRIFYIFATRNDGRGIISQLDSAIEKGEEKFDLSGGEQLRDFLPVEKVAEYIVKISVQDKVTGIINCCSGVPVSIRNLVENRVKEKGSNIKLNFGCYDYPDYEPMAFWGDPAKLKKILSNEQ